MLHQLNTSSDMFQEFQVLRPQTKITLILLSCIYLSVLLGHCFWDFFQTKMTATKKLSLPFIIQMQKCFTLHLWAVLTLKLPGSSGKRHEVAEVINQGEDQVTHCICILKEQRSSQNQLYSCEQRLNVVVTSAALCAVFSYSLS